MAYDKLDYTQIEYDDLKCRARLKGLRQDNDLKQKQVAEFLGIARSSYSDYENGRLRIPIEYLVRLAGFYNVDVSYICGISSSLLARLRKGGDISTHSISRLCEIIDCDISDILSYQKDDSHDIEQD